MSSGELGGYHTKPTCTVQNEPARIAPGSTAEYDVAAFRLRVVLANRLDPMAALDAVGHALVALGATVGEPMLGRSHRDGSDGVHSALAKYPLVVLTARPARIGKLVRTAHSVPSVQVVDYPDEGHTTTYDGDYAAALAAKSGPTIVYRAAALFGPRAAVDELCGHFTLFHPWLGAPRS